MAELTGSTERPMRSEPYATYSCAVRREWLDYNGHMHDASYATVLSDANEELFASLGLSADYREQSGAAFYTIETHVRFRAECSLGQTLRARTILVSATPKTMRLYTELVHDDGRVAATGDSLYLHVDAALGRTTPMPDDRLARVQEMLTAHAGLPRPADLGLGVGERATSSSGSPR